MEVLEIHRYPQFMDQCCDLINMEWPRSKTARLRRLEMSCDNFPICLVLVHSREVLGHSRLSSLPSLPLGCLIESGSIVVHPEHRGKGLGKFLMTKSEDLARRRGLKTLYLYTRDKQGFYSKIGYKECEPVQIYGTHVQGQNSKNVPSNETEGCINIPVQAVSPTLSVPSVSNTYPQTRILDQHNTCPQPEPPPPPPPPLPPKSIYSATLRPSYTCMKKNL